MKSLIKPGHGRLSDWPSPDDSTLPKDQQPRFRRLKHAIELYEEHSFAKIRQITGVPKSTLVRIIKRCQKSDGRGGIVGFFACIEGYRVEPYERTTPVLHIAGTSRGGCAGALQQLLAKFPELKTFIKKQLFPNESTNDPDLEPVVSFEDLSRKVRTWLQEAGLQPWEWPLNTIDQGSESLRTYYHSLGVESPFKWAKNRGGKNAVSRMRVSRATRSLLRPLRPYSHLQMDFQKVDVACTIVIDYEDGTSIEVPLVRFHIGLIVEKHRHPIVGAYVLLETNPSAEGALETIASAVIPVGTEASSDPWFVCLKEAKALPNLVIGELAGQCAAVFEVDNAWYSIATEHVDRIVDYLGAAVVWGPVYSWWGRSIVEMVIGDLTRLGAQRLPSTFGTSPQDPKVIDAVNRALNAKVRLTDVMRTVADAIRELNTRPSEGANRSNSPFESLAASVGTPESGFLPQLLPRPDIACPRICWTQVQPTIHGNMTAGYRPYVQFERGRYTGEKLESAWHLIGKKTQGWVSNRDARLMDLSIKATGEDLGRLRVLPPLDELPHSLRMRKIVNRSTRTRRHAHRGVDPIAQAQRERVARIRELRRKGRQKASRDALDAAEQARYGQPNAAPEPPPQGDVSSSRPIGRRRPLPPLPPVYRGGKS